MTTQLSRVMLRCLLLALVLWQMGGAAQGQLSALPESLASVQPSVRIESYSHDGLAVALTGSVHPSANARNEIGLADANYLMEHMVLTLQSDSAQQAALDQLVKEQQDPTSPNYHKWLTPAEFGKRFGAAQADIDAISNWLRSYGFVIDEVPANNRAIVFSGTAQQVELAFRTEIRKYSVNGEVHYANATPVQIPASLAPVVAGVVSLHDFLSNPMNTARIRGAAPAVTGSNHLGPADFAKIYNVAPLYQSGFNGNAQNIAIVGRSNIALSDVAAFRTYFGLAAKAPTVVLNGTNPGVLSAPGELEEALLDVEWAGAVAPNANIKFVVTKSTPALDGSFASAAYIVNHSVAPVMSMSFGACESALGTAGNQYFNNLWQQAASQGITVLVASGDSGAAGCDDSSASTGTARAVNGLCSTPYSTCVGGTQFDDTTGAYWNGTPDPTTKLAAIGYIPETAWNESSPGLAAGGGGASSIYTKPDWQTGPGVPSDGHRDVPDISMSAAAHDGYTVFKNGSPIYVGGTSAASPAFAGIMALVLQRVGQAQGNINPVLYDLPNLNLPIFHDITAGTNTVPGVTGFNAGPGYDQATGLGSVDASVFVQNWKSTTKSLATTSFTVVPVATVTALQAGSVTDAVTVTFSNGFSGTVAMTATTPTGITASYSPGTLSASGDTTLTLAVDKAVKPGSYSVTATGTGSDNSVVTAQIKVTVIAPFSLTLTSSPLTMIQTGSGTVDVAAVPASGFSSDVTLAVTGAPSGMTTAWDNTSNGTLAKAAGKATLTVAADKTVKAASYTLTVTGTGNGVAQTATLKVVVGAPFTVKPSAASVSMIQTGSGTVDVSATPATGFASDVVLVVTGAPTGMTTSWDNTSNGTLAKAAGKATLTIAADKTVKAASYTLTITGTGAGVAETTTVKAVVGAPFTVTPSAASVSMIQTGSGTFDVSATPATGFASDVVLVVTGAPTGMTTSWDNTSKGTLTKAAGKATLTVAADKTVKAASYTLTITGTGAGVAATTTVKAVVGAPFAVKTSVASVSMTQTGSGTLDVSATPATGFASDVVLTVSGAPTGMTATWDNTSNGTLTKAAGKATLTLAADKTVKVASYTLTITGTGAGVAETATVKAVVLSPFTLATSVASVPMIQTGSGTVDVTTVLPAGFPFTSDVVLAVSGLPTGMTSAWDNTSKGTLAKAAGAATLTLTADKTVKPAGYTVTITGTGNGVAQTATVKAVVGAPFAVKTSAASVSMIQTGSGTLDVSATPATGFASDVVLTVSGAPTGMTATWDNTSNGTLTKAAGKATLTLAADKTVKAASYTLTITGTGAGVPETATVKAVVGQPFAVNTSVASVSIIETGSGTLDVSATPATGFASDVVLTVSGAPTGMTATWDNTSKGTLAKAAGKATLTLAADKTVKAASYTLTITGTGAGVPETATVKVVVGAPFELKTSLASVSIIETGSGTLDVSATPATGFASDVALVVTGAPTGMTATWDNTSNGTLTKAAGKATLTVAADKTVKAASYTLTITGTGAGVAETATVKVTVGAPFALKTSAASLSVIETGSGTLDVSATPATGFASDVVLVVTGAPTGMTATWDNTSNGTLTKAAGKATLTVAADKTVKVGSYTLTITGTGAGVAETATVKVAVGAPFAVTPSATSVSMIQTGSGTFDVSATPATGFASDVVLVVTGAPTGMTATWDNTSKGTLTKAAGKATLTVAADKTVKAASYTLTITGTGAGVAETATVKAVVGAPFAVKTSVASVSMIQTGSGTLDVSATPATGFASDVVLTVSGAPTGMTTTWDNTSNGTLTKAAGKATLTVAADKTVKAASYTLTITGTGAGVPETTTAKVVVGAPFTVTPSATSVSMIQTGSGTLDVSATPATGFASDVVLVVTGAPTGMTTTWDNTSKGTLTKAAGKATLTVAADKTLKPGSYSLTITGTGAGVAETATVKAVVGQPFALKTSVASVSIIATGSGTVDVSATPATGFASDVALVVTGAPTGMTATWDNTSNGTLTKAAGQATLTVAADKTVKPASYTLTITGTGAGVPETATVKIVVAAPFAVTPSASSVSLILTGSGTVDVSATPGTGFASDVVLVVTGAPTGITATWDNTSNGTLTKAAGKATLTIAADKTVKPASYTLTITGTGAGVAETATIKAVVAAPFSLQPSAASVSVAQSGSNTVDISATPATGFTSDIALVVTGAPAGLTTTWDNTSNGTLAKAAGKATLTLAASNSLKAGTYTLTITGTGAGVAETTTVKTVVTVP